MDAANVDLKAFTEGFYARRCVGALEPVLDTLKYLVHETDVWTEITTLIIPGENDSDDEIEALTRWVARELRRDVPLHFTAFHPDYHMLETPPTPPATLQKARSIAIRNGLDHVLSATSTIRRARRRSARPAAPARSSATAIRSGGTRSTRRARARTAGRGWRGVFAAKPGQWGSRRSAGRHRALRVVKIRDQVSFGGQGLILDIPIAQSLIGVR